MLVEKGDLYTKGLLFNGPEPQDQSTSTVKLQKIIRVSRLAEILKINVARLNNMESSKTALILGGNGMIGDILSEILPESDTPGANFDKESFQSFVCSKVFLCQFRFFGYFF